MKKKKGFTLIELLVVIAIIAMLLAILMPALGKVKKLAMRLVCGTNCKGMANAMNVYAFDYDDEFPIAGGQGAAQWAAATDEWNVPSTANRANVTVAASLFMLVREADVGVKSFVCTASDETPFVNETGFDIIELWDFGGPGDTKNQTPQKCQSYSYQIPYKNAAAPGLWFPADGTSDPGNAILGDKSPWYDDSLTKRAPSGEDYIPVVWEIQFADNAPKWAYQVGNSAAHDREGQNVLFGDGHVDFAKRPDVGTRYDNIYTQQSGGIPDKFHKGVGKTGIGGTLPLNKEDSLLVNDESCN